jgi:hypothetical protein
MKDIKKEFFITIPIFLQIFNIKGEQLINNFLQKKNKSNFRIHMMDRIQNFPNVEIH